MTAKLRVLVIDDDLAACAKITQILEKHPNIDVRAGKAEDEAPRWGDAGPDIVICSVPGYRAILDCLPSSGLQRDSCPPLLLVVDDADITRSLFDNECRPDDIIAAPPSENLLFWKIRSLLNVRQLRRTLHQKESALAEADAQLKRNAAELADVLLTTLDIRLPDTLDRARTAKAIAEFMGRELNLPDERQSKIVFAAQLHEIGKIGLPPEVLAKPSFSLPATLLPTYQQHTKIGSMILSKLSGWNESALFVHHQLENCDGSGFPDELLGEEIPLGARILRAIVLQEEFQARGCSIEETIENVRTSMHAILEQKIANTLIQFLVVEQSRNVDVNRCRLRVEELKPGMLIAEDVYAASGAKLLPKGVQLQPKMLELLAARDLTDPIIGGVYILTDWSLLDG